MEIAFFGDRMYISFPPFPSIFLLPFVIIYGYSTPDQAIALGLSLVSMIYAYKIALHFLKNKKTAMFFALFLILGTNYLHISLWGAVWYLAQNMAFTFLLISIYYALTDNKRHSFISLFALCASMGCRPFNALYLPIILFLILKREEANIKTFAKNIFIYAIPAILLGGFYMWLNYTRFGSIFEFGHNFLPEFTLDPYGQFHSSRVLRNMSMMFFGVDISYPLRHGFPYEGRTTFAFWLASPIFISFVVYQVVYWRKYTGKTVDDFLIKIVPVLVFLHIFAFSLHRTLGGRQFGSRYIADSLPIVYFGLLMMVAKISQGVKPPEALPVEPDDEIIEEVEEEHENEITLSEAEEGENESLEPEAEPLPIPITRHIIYNAAPMLFGALINFHGTVMFFLFYFPFYY